MKNYFFAVAVLSAIPLHLSAQESGWYKAKSTGSAISCSDKNIIAEVHDISLHNPSYSGLNALMAQGGCGVIADTVKFRLLSRIVQQLPAGPQPLANIAVPIASNPNLPPSSEWMMQDDIEPDSQKP